jgi:hypothetical protein
VTRHHAIPLRLMRASLQTRIITASKHTNMCTEYAPPIRHHTFAAKPVAGVVVVGQDIPPKYRSLPFASGNGQRNTQHDSASIEMYHQHDRACIVIGTHTHPYLLACNNAFAISCTRGYTQGMQPRMTYHEQTLYERAPALIFTEYQSSPPPGWDPHHWSRNVSLNAAHIRPTSSYPGRYSLPWS